MRNKGIIFNIQRFSIHDGPGIRTTIFLKGCSMACFWCHNPEGRKTEPEIQFYPERCIACGECLTACSHKLHQVINEMHHFDRDRCTGCGTCTETCYANALELIGEEMTVEQIMAEVLRDRIFYDNSNGGVTLSGGEPALNSSFTSSLLEKCKQEGLHTAIETCGNIQWKKLADILPVTDLVMMDIKHIDEKKHKQVTKSSNDLILENARRLVMTNKPIIFRTPVVPTVNETEKEIGDIVDFIKSLVELRMREQDLNHENCNIEFELLPFHRMAADKYRSLGLDYHAHDLKPLNNDQMEKLVKIAKKRGLKVKG